MNESKTFGLTHIAIYVKNIERTLKFYQSVFGMQIMYNEKGFVQITTPGCNDILVFEEKKDMQVGQSGDILHFGFRLKAPEDIDEIVNKVKEAGGVIIDIGEFVPGSPYVFFKDPDGYKIEVWYELLK